MPEEEVPLTLMETTWPVSVKTTEKIFDLNPIQVLIIILFSLSLLSDIFPVQRCSLFSGDLDFNLKNILFLKILDCRSDIERSLIVGSIDKGTSTLLTLTEHTPTLITFSVN
jgi:hypothetical protein